MLTYAVLMLQVDEVLAGRDYAVMVLGYKHLHGIDGVGRSCPLC
jgi:hypothetical protein